MIGIVSGKAGRLNAALQTNAVRVRVRVCVCVCVCVCVLRVYGIVCGLNAQLLVELRVRVCLRIHTGACAG